MMPRWNACDLPDWYRNGRLSDMPLNPEALHCAARIIGEREDKPGTRGIIGTGFFLSVRSEVIPDKRHVYLLTAHHVLAEQNEVELVTTNLALGGVLNPPITVRKWCQPLEGVDLAIAPVSLPRRFGVVRLLVDVHLLRADQRDELYLGSRVYYIGILMPHDRAMVRSGTLGALDQNGLDLGGVYGFPAHLVDCRSYGGFSGSPCFVDLAFAELTPTDTPLPVPQEPGRPPVGDLRHVTMMCGMFTNHADPPNEDRAASRLGVGVMLRSEEIMEALMADKLRKNRADEDNAEAAETENAGRFDQAQAGKAESEFERFEDLTRRLVNTPKSEVDEKRRPEKKS